MNEAEIELVLHSTFHCYPAVFHTEMGSMPCPSLGATFCFLGLNALSLSKSLVITAFFKFSLSSFL